MDIGGDIESNIRVVGTAVGADQFSRLEAALQKLHLQVSKGAGASKAAATSAAMHTEASRQNASAAEVAARRQEMLAIALAKVDVQLRADTVSAQKLAQATRESSNMANAAQDAQKKHAASVSSVGSQIQSVIVKYGIAAVAIREFANTIKAAAKFDEGVDKLAVSARSSGLAWDEIGDKIRNVAMEAAKGTIFDGTQMLGAMEKFRDRGYEVIKLTEEQMHLMGELATATMQDIDVVSDATATAMRQFSIPISRMSDVVEIQNNAMREAGLTAEQFREAITGAGAAAAQSGTSLASYVAIVTRLKQLGYDSSQFEKLFTATLAAPTPEQLRVFQRRGVSPYKAPEEFNNGIGLMTAVQALGETLPGRLGESVRESATAARIRAETMRKNAEETQSMQEELLKLADAQDAVAGRTRMYEELVGAITEKIEGLKNAQAEWKDQLKETTAALTKAKTILEETKKSLSLLGDPKISGMQAFDDHIAQLQLTVKQQELQVLRTEDATVAYANTLVDTTGKVVDLRSELEKLRSVELSGEKAYNEQAYRIQQQIKEAQLKQLKLAPHQLFENNAFDAQIAKLQRQFSIVNLERDLRFDPARKAIADSVDAASGKTAMTPEEAKARAGALSAAMRNTAPATAAANAALEAAQRDAQRAQLERDVQFGPDELRIQQAARDAEARLGLRPAEQSASVLLASIPQLEATYASVNRSVEGLTVTKEQLDKVVAAYDEKIGEQTVILDGYKRGLDESKRSADAMEKQMADLQTRFEEMEKPIKDQAVLLDEMGKAGFTAADGYEILGKRAGAAMTALLGATDADGNRANVKSLAEMAEQMERIKETAKDAFDVENDLYGVAARAAAAKRNAEITVGSAVINVVDGVINNIKSSDYSGGGFLDAARGAAGLPARGVTPITPEARARIEAMSPEERDAFYRRIYPNVQRRANGGIVSGVGNRDTVPAFLTPGEEVLTKNDPRHQRNGGGGKTELHIHGNIVLNHEKDEQAFFRRLSTYLEDERKRAAAGMA